MSDAVKVQTKVFLARDLSQDLGAASRRMKRSKFEIAQPAVTSYLSPDGDEMALTRRLDRISRSIDRARDVTISNEAVALFVKAWLPSKIRKPNGSMLPEIVTCDGEEMVSQYRHFIYYIQCDVGCSAGLSNGGEKLQNPLLRARRLAGAFGAAGRSAPPPATRMRGLLCGFISVGRR